MPYVLDTSITMAWCFFDESTEYTRNILEELLISYAEVPALWIFEVVNVLAVNERKGRITTLGAETFIKTLAALDIRVQAPIEPIESPALLSLSRKHRLTSYDAAYLELAQRKRLPLATLDQDLVRAASLEGVALAP